MGTAGAGGRRSGASSARERGAAAGRHHRGPGGALHSGLPGRVCPGAGGVRWVSTDRSGAPPPARPTGTASPRRSGVRSGDRGRSGRRPGGRAGPGAGRGRWCSRFGSPAGHGAPDRRARFPSGDRCRVPSWRRWPRPRPGRWLSAAARPSGGAAARRGRGWWRSSARLPQLQGNRAAQHLGQGLPHQLGAGFHHRQPVRGNLHQGPGAGHSCGQSD